MASGFYFLDKFNTSFYRMEYFAILALFLVGVWLYRLLFTPSRISLFYNKNINNINIKKSPPHKEFNATDENSNNNTKWLDYLMVNCPSLSGKRLFYPTPWLYNGHLQTVLTSKISSRGKKIEYDRELFPLSDGGQVGLDWYPERSRVKKIDTPLIVLVHGLTGNSQEGYCRATVKRLTEKETFRVVVLNYRGCGGVEVLTPRAYNGGDTRDLKEVLVYIRDLFPTIKLFGVGFSLGANLLVKYLGEEGQDSIFSGAISISNPFDLVDLSYVFLTETIQRNIYDPALTSGLENLLGKHSIFKGHYIERKWKRVRDVDRDFTRKMGGFQTVNDYYRWASSDQFITRVKVPLLILNAKDDPISPKLAIPYEECKYNPYVLLATTNVGGHIGWWEGFAPRHWFPSLVKEYFEALAEVLEQNIPEEYLLKADLTSNIC